MHSISKDFEFCYGHRVWNQQLDANYAGDLTCACRHLHGHEGKLTVHMKAKELVRGMVTDFRHLDWLKKWINQYIDHRFIIDSNDPLYSHLTLGRAKTPVTFEWVYDKKDLVKEDVASELDLTGLDVNTAEYELLSGFLVVDFVPTSENLAEWMCNLISKKMVTLADVVQIDWWETPKSKSTYTEPI